MHRRRWIVIGGVATVLILFLIWANKPKTPAPSLGGSELILSGSGKLSLAGDSTSYSGPVEKHHRNGQKSYALEIVDGVKQGLATEWYDNGKKRTEVTLKSGMPVGVMNGWHENGIQSFKMPLVDGEHIMDWPVLHCISELESTSLRYSFSPML